MKPPPSPSSDRALIAGFGNVLRGDDAFGVEVVRPFAEARPESRLTVLELGIGGITLIQELLDDYQVVVIVDALAAGQEPGSLSWSQLDVDDCRELSLAERQALLADIHYANPNRALVLARALDLLPKSVFLLGCEVDPEHALGTELSPAVRQAIPRARAELERWIAAFLGHNGPKGVP